ncbi:MAG: leucyl/phenylalanyl-tRNA--protein transferase [Mariprofundaceae bacterium]
MIEFPNPEKANEDGLLAIGGDLEPQTLLNAYVQGVFPWYSEGQPVLWWSPDPRMVLFSNEFYCSKRLARRLKQPQYRFSWDEAFDQVVQHCAEIPRKGESGTWILPEMITAYCRLHEMGHAHSVEVWQGDELIGGVYGVLQNRIFFAESMFSTQCDGSKMALAKLIERAQIEQWKMIDTQFYTAHLESLGAREISRAYFIAQL